MAVATRETEVGGHQRYSKYFAQYNIRCVVGRETRSQGPNPREQWRCGITNQLELVEVEERFVGSANLDFAAQDELTKAREDLQIDQMRCSDLGFRFNRGANPRALGPRLDQIVNSGGGVKNDQWLSRSARTRSAGRDFRCTSFRDRIRSVSSAIVGRSALRSTSRRRYSESVSPASAALILSFR